jgi:hypothetical protein
MEVLINPTLTPQPSNPQTSQTSFEGSLNCVERFPQNNPLHECGLEGSLNSVERFSLEGSLTQPTEVEDCGFVRGLRVRRGLVPSTVRQVLL